MEHAGGGVVTAAGMRLNKAKRFQMQKKKLKEKRKAR